MRIQWESGLLGGYRGFFAGSGRCAVRVTGAHQRCGRRWRGKGLGVEQSTGLGRRALDGLGGDPGAGLSPLQGCFIARRHETPRLAPWATFCRRYVAGIRGGACWWSRTLCPGLLGIRRAHGDGGRGLGFGLRVGCWSPDVPVRRRRRRRVGRTRPGVRRIGRRACGPCGRRRAGGRGGGSWACGRGAWGRGVRRGGA